MSIRKIFTIASSPGTSATALVASNPPKVRKFWVAAEDQDCWIGPPGVTVATGLLIPANRPATIMEGHENERLDLADFEVICQVVGKVSVAWLINQ